MVDEPSMREWLVAAALIETESSLLLVQNQRRNGVLDWSTPGGVIEEGEETLAGLAREVHEETGVTVIDWHGPVYRVETIAPDFGWHLRVEVFRALTWKGELIVDDPDGIVIDARFVPFAQCAATLDANAQWVREPLCEWLSERWDGSRDFSYDLAGADRSSMVVTRRR